MKQDSCIKCEATSKDRPLVKIEVNNEEKKVCVKCLPQLIHG